MDYEQIKRYLTSEGELISARVAESKVPNAYGLYSINLDHPTSLPPPFCHYAQGRNIQTIYIGKAATSFLSTRLVKNDLRHKGHGSFFRSLGALLGHRPLPGSLSGKANQQNYRFPDPAKQQIIDWINRHLSIRCLSLEQKEIAIERTLIADLKPILNIDGNPEALVELIELRARCRAIACAFANEKVTQENDV